MYTQTKLTGCSDRLQPAHKDNPQGQDNEARVAHPATRTVLTYTTLPFAQRWTIPRSEDKRGISPFVTIFSRDIRLPWGKNSERGHWRCEVIKKKIRSDRHESFTRTPRARRPAPSPRTTPLPRPRPRTTYSEQGDNGQFGCRGCRVLTLATPATWPPFVVAGSSLFE